MPREYFYKFPHDDYSQRERKRLFARETRFSVKTDPSQWRRYVQNARTNTRSNPRASEISQFVYRRGDSSSESDRAIASIAEMEDARG